MPKDKEIEVTQATIGRCQRCGADRYGTPGPCLACGEHVEVAYAVVFAPTMPHHQHCVLCGRAMVGRVRMCEKCEGQRAARWDMTGDIVGIDVEANTITVRPAASVSGLRTSDPVRMQVWKRG